MIKSGEQVYNYWTGFIRRMEREQIFVLIRSKMRVRNNKEIILAFLQASCSAQDLAVSNLMDKDCN